MKNDETYDLSEELNELTEQVSALELTIKAMLFSLQNNDNFKKDFATIIDTCIEKFPDSVRKHLLEIKEFSDTSALGYPKSSE